MTGAKKINFFKVKHENFVKIKYQSLLQVMDSSDPYSHSSNFIDLLNSQGSSNYSQPIPSETYSQTISFGSSDVPQGQAQPKARKVRKERNRWSQEEDLILINCWLNTSKDPIVANEQKLEAFWGRISAMYNVNAKVPSDGKRKPSQCKERWRKNHTQVCKFCGAYEAATSVVKSGWDDKDYLRLAHEIYHSDEGAKFMLMHARNELRYDQKFCANSHSQGQGKGKKTKSTADAGQTSTPLTVTIDYDEVMERPPGVKAAKAAKAKAKRGARQAVDSQERLMTFKTMTEMRSKVSDKNCLERLLAKAEPLSEIEEALKTKLITEMLSS